MRDKLYVCISLDVEEEGLFSGKYPSRSVSVTNVPLLKKLAPLSQHPGFPLTLFCAYSVFNDISACETINWMREHAGAEVGAHLHHWSTPPYDQEPVSGAPIRTHLLDPAIFRQRLENLLAIGRKKTGQQLVSFRMGRWDLKKALLPVLAQAGIRVDSSICPLRAFKNGPDHFLAPASPYIVATDYGDIVEAPITQIPLWAPLARVWHRLWQSRPDILDSFHFFGALSANPVWHTDAIMKLAVKIHVARGGRLLNLFWHSSEMLPGASPNVPDQKAADTLLARISSFCQWLGQEFETVGITAAEIPELLRLRELSPVRMEGSGDWQI